MEQSYDCPLTMEEVEVANTMLELPHLILESESCSRFSFTWGTKRKRSTGSKQEVVAVTPLPALKLSSPPPLSLPSNVVGSIYKTEEPIEKTLTSSPLTPLSFSPSESDEKPLPSQIKSPVKSLKRKKDEWLEEVDDLTQSNELQKKLSQSQDYHHYHHHRRQQQQQICTRVCQQPFIMMDQTIGKQEINKNFQYPFGQMISLLPPNTGGLSKVHDNNVGSFGLLDLNVSAEEAFGFSCSSQSIDIDTVTKARAAQARLKRKQICRSKNFNSACKARCPFR